MPTTETSDVVYHNQLKRTLVRFLGKIIVLSLSSSLNFFVNKYMFMHNLTRQHYKKYLFKTNNTR